MITQIKLSPMTFVLSVIGIGFGSAILATVIFFSGHTFDQNHSADPHYLRVISQASAIYAQDHRDAYPATMSSDVWDFAERLATGAGLTEMKTWMSPLDPACKVEQRGLSILLPPESVEAPHRPNPVFRQVKPALAVALGPITFLQPDTVPIAWTRGLQLDGTWATHSPYGRQGGYIAFKDSTVKPFHDLKKDGGQLVRFDGKGKTSNILDALPPGSRISEYEPTDAEKMAWSKAPRAFDPFRQN